MSTGEVLFRMFDIVAMELLEHVAPAELKDRLDSAAVMRAKNLKRIADMEKFGDPEK